MFETNPGRVLFQMQDSISSQNTAIVFVQNVQMFKNEINIFIKENSFTMQNIDTKQIIIDEFMLPSWL